MLVEIGHFALILALLVAAVQSVVPLIGASLRSRPLMDLAPPAALLQFGLAALAFAVFMHAHIVSDFSVRNVFENSHTAKPMLYKVSGVWGSHEGSMMLWVLMLTLFGGLVAAFGRALPLGLRARTLAIQGLLGFGTLLFIIANDHPTRFPAAAGRRTAATSTRCCRIRGSPFTRRFSISAICRVLDYLLFRDRCTDRRAGRGLGALGAALGAQRLVWADDRHRDMGSWWAYYVLGWGGWWYWDRSRTPPSCRGSWGRRSCTRQPSSKTRNPTALDRASSDLDLA
jgi:cytochrome c-type biogenesis protein CcmF